ncbi:hypothetical protein ISCGN_002910 [Ixodes scapularis]
MPAAEDECKRNGQSGVVYKVQCGDCDATYIGETGRNRATRLKEHKRDVAKATHATRSKTELVEHCWTTGHSFDLDNATTLAREQRNFFTIFFEHNPFYGDNAGTLESLEEFFLTSVKEVVLREDSTDGVQCADSRLREAGAEVVYCLARGAPKGPNLPQARLNHQDALFPGHGKATHSQTWAGEPAWLGVRGDATLQTPAFTGDYGFGWCLHFRVFVQRYCDPFARTKQELDWFKMKFLGVPDWIILVATALVLLYFPRDADLPRGHTPDQASLSSRLPEDRGNRQLSRSHAETQTSPLVSIVRKHPVPRPRKRAPVSQRGVSGGQLPLCRVARSASPRSRTPPTPRRSACSAAPECRARDSVPGTRTSHVVTPRTKHPSRPVSQKIAGTGSSPDHTPRPKRLHLSPSSVNTRSQGRGSGPPFLSGVSGGVSSRCAGWPARRRPEAAPHPRRVGRHVRRRQNAEPETLVTRWVVDGAARKPNLLSGWPIITSGLANPGGACGLWTRGAIVEDVPKTFSGVVTFAHECGHLLGIAHDGSPPQTYVKNSVGAERCPASKRYIMSPSMGVTSIYKFSYCSTEQLYMFVGIGDRPSEPLLTEHVARRRVDAATPGSGAEPDSSLWLRGQSIQEPAALPGEDSGGRRRRRDFRPSTFGSSFRPAPLADYPAKPFPSHDAV